MPDNTLYLIDGSSYVFRAYYGIKADLSTSKGFPTNATYGFVTMLLKFLKENRPRYLAMVFDPKGKVFRNNIYPEYKANRDEAPESLKIQFPKIFELVEAFSIPMFSIEGYEADDIMGTIATANAKGETEVVLVTGDKDFCQLVSKRITLLDTMKNTKTDPQQVQQKYGVSPEQMVDLFALVGDKSDNVPGVLGVGVKTAAKLISDYENLDGVYDNLDKIRGSVAKRLSAHKEVAYMSRELVAIKTDVPVPTEITNFKYEDSETKRLAQIFKELEFNNLLKELSDENTNKQGEEAQYDRYEIVSSRDKLEEVIAGAEKAKELSIKIETDSELPMNAKIAGFSLCFSLERAFYVPVGHHVGNIPVFGQMKLEEALLTLKPILESKDIKKIGHNIKYEMLALRNHDVTLKGAYFDTMLAGHLLDSSRNNYKLGELSRTILGRRLIPHEEITGKGKHKKNYAEVDIKTAKNYSCEKSNVALALSKELLQTLSKENLFEFYEKNVLEFLCVLCDMEFTGVAVDNMILEQMSEEFERDLNSIETRIYEKTEQRFNINSTKQLAEILFKKLGLPAGRKTAKGAFSTDSEVLQNLSTMHEVPNLLLKHRLLSKLKSTYVDQLPKLVNPKTKRIHTSFNPAGTLTGRLSSSDPNLQNIPIKTSEGKRIRRAFAAKNECLILSADYSQIEIRLLAHFSGDPTLLQSLRSGKDVHLTTACEIFNAGEAEITSELRNHAKTINFGIIYGISPFRLSKQLGMPVSEAKNYIDRYFEKYSKVKEYMRSSIESARTKKYAETLVGRRRPIPELFSKNKIERSRGEREAINTPIQGSAADIINLGMVRIFRRFEKQGFSSKMILQVHDELLFEVYEDELERLRVCVKEEMENAWDLAVPFRVEIREGQNWADVH